ncbi:MAG: pSer/pThr/pTyr-binding forkhead associated (FHA) protein, partial [Polyangiales bacterium]
MIRLEVLSGGSLGATLETEADLIRLGRSDTSELMLADHHVSGEHASIVFNGQGYVLRDHHSTNGTRVERGADVVELAQQQGRELPLLSGDVIELGERSGAVKVAVTVDEEDDDAGIVSVRQLADFEEVQREAPRELLQ